MSIVVALGLGAASCADRDESAPPKAALKPVSLPDLSRLSPSIQEQLRARHAALTRVLETPGSDAERAAAFGDAGMMLMAAEYRTEADAALTNAEALAPGELRWPYYLGHLHREAGRGMEAARAFERAVAIDGAYAPALIWLGNAYLDQGRPGDAEALFNKALRGSVQHAAVAHLGLGRAALARRDHQAAVRHLEQVLALDPAADAANYPLALAYRALGDEAKAATYAKARGLSPDLRMPDRLMDDVEVLFESAVSYEVRGARALDEGKWTEAAELFRKGMEIAPEEPSLRHKYGTAQALAGDSAGARRTFEEVARRFPAFAKAQYSLGLLKAGAGDVAGAIQSWTAAIGAQPNYVEARLQLAHALRRTGRAAAAVPHYARILEVDTRIIEARYGHAMALVASGRFADARDRLAEAMKSHPDQPAFAVALVRVLSAAPDAAVRDGQRALAIADGFPESQRTVEWAVARAMALAEAGRFDEAAQMQRSAVQAAEQAGFAEGIRGMRATLALYERRQPSRAPWRADEPMELPE